MDRRASFEVRPLGPDDDELLDAALRASRGEPSPAPDLFLTDPHAHGFVAVQGGRVVGWAFGQEILRPEGRWVIVLFELGVAPDVRERRIGRGLLEAFAELARARGHRRMWLFTDAGPRRLAPSSPPPGASGNPARPATGGSSGSEPRVLGQQGPWPLTTARGVR
ncbi:MAG: GNAT family N-acetyltransferase [Candidatus Velamenicoccus archaeovorus]